MHQATRLLRKLILPMAITFSTQAFSLPTNFGDITDGSATYTNFLATNILGLIVVNPEDIRFTLGNVSDLTIDFTTFLNIDLGGEFELSKIGGGYTSTFTPPLLNLAGSYSKSFNDLVAGDYQFKYIPSLLSLGLSADITFTATTVPEPGNTAMLFAGLAISAIAIRKKHASSSKKG